MTSKELVTRALEFQAPPRVPRIWGALPCASDKYPEQTAALYRDFPCDIACPQPLYKKTPRTVGNMFEIGQYTDEWGCTFENIHYGVIGEVKEPIVNDWSNLSRVHFPKEWLTLDTDGINRFYESTDKYTCASWTPRPFEQLQFLRGTETLYIDLMEQEPDFLHFLDLLHNLYCETLTQWAKSDLDMLVMQDDWGAQKQLLIPPAVFRRLFLPMYREYIRIAHSHGKKIYMHSDGYILEILPDLIDAGLDAVNAQIFCMGIDRLAPFAGKITFWGEIDRQYLLAYATPDEVEQAVWQVYRTLWKDGGCIAHLEFGPGAKPENVRRALETWNRVLL